MDELKQVAAVEMRRQIRELGAEVWVARQRGDHKTAYDLELARDDLRRALTKLKTEAATPRLATGTDLGTCPVE